MSNVIPFRKIEKLSYDEAVEEQRQDMLVQKAQALIKEAKADSGVFIFFDEMGLWRYHYGEFADQKKVEWGFSQSFNTLCEEMERP